MFIEDIRGIFQNIIQYVSQCHKQQFVTHSLMRLPVVNHFHPPFLGRGDVWGMGSKLPGKYWGTKSVR
jgi:hypothetical protein